ncbi:MAG: hypothetical protein AB1512_26390 [Thermodesulfobacteriota bacterium]
MIDDKDLYAAVAQHVANAEQVSWNRFNNFLMSNSIFILAWATLYAADPIPPRARLILCSICTVGVLSSVVWAALGYRGRKNVGMFLDLGKRMELDPNHTSAAWAGFGPCDCAIKLRDSMPYRWAGSFWILSIGSFVFTFLYVLLLWVSFCR